MPDRWIAHRSCSMGLPEMMHFHGLSAFPLTPADEHGQVDIVALCALLKRLTDARVGSIGLLGSTGSYAYLTRSERRKTIDAALEQVAGTTPLLVGIGALRTDDAVQFGQDAKSAGADGVLLAADVLHAVDRRRGVRAFCHGGESGRSASVHLRQSWHHALHLQPGTGCAVEPGGEHRCRQDAGLRCRHGQSARVAGDDRSRLLHRSQRGLERDRGPACRQ